MKEKIFISFIEKNSHLKREGKVYRWLIKEEEKELAFTQLINRFILPEEIADSIVFLIRNDAVCGEVLVIDGGMSLKTLD